MLLSSLLPESLLPISASRSAINQAHAVRPYNSNPQSQSVQSGRQVEICAAAKEKFFDQVVLVMLDLPSGYILVEELTENRQYTTWQLSAQKILQDFGHGLIIV